MGAVAKEHGRAMIVIGALAWALILGASLVAGIGLVLLGVLVRRSRWSCVPLGLGFTLLSCPVCPFLLLQFTEAPRTNQQLTAALLAALALGSGSTWLLSALYARGGNVDQREQERA